MSEQVSRLTASAEVATNVETMRAYLAAHPDAWAQLVGDEQFIKQMYHESGAKVDVQLQQIHAPAETARKRTGYGRTLCNNTGVRGERVTCKHCLRALARRAA